MDFYITLDIVNKLDHPLVDVRLRWLEYILKSIKYDHFKNNVIAFTLASKLLEWLAKHPTVEEKAVLESLLHIIKNFKFNFSSDDTEKLYKAVSCVKKNILSENAILINLIKKELEGHVCSSEISDSSKTCNNKESSDNTSNLSFALTSFSQYPINSKDIKNINKAAELLRDGYICEGCTMFVNSLLFNHPPEVFLHLPIIIENLLRLSQCDKETVKFFAINTINTFALNLLERSKNNLYAVEIIKTYDSEDNVDLPASLMCDQFCIKVSKIVLKFFKNKCYNQYSEFISFIYQELFMNIVNILKSFSMQLEDIDDLAQDVATVLSILRSSRNFILQNLLFFNFLQVACDICKISRNSLLLSELEGSIMDPILEFMHPEIHRKIILVVSTFNLPISKTFENVKNLCHLLDSALDIIKINKKSLPECLEQCMLSLPCLVILNSFALIEQIILNCSKVQIKENEQLLNTATSIILKLLSYKNENIKLWVYTSIFKQVKQVLGVHKISYFTAGPKTLFSTGIPINSDIIMEIACRGTQNGNSEISTYACNILLMILKSNMTTDTNHWMYVLKHIIPTLPILQCITDKNTSLGQNLHDLVNPDIASKINISHSDILKSNIRLLFSKDPEVRQESVSRLLYLLNKRSDSKILLPNCTVIAGTLHSNLCIHTDNQIRLGVRSKEPLNFHSVTAINPLLEVLSDENTDPIVLKSSVLQLSIILDDCYLHGVFSTIEDVKVLIKLFPKALALEEFNEFSNTVIALINILRKLCAYNRVLRIQLAECDDILTYILRALFLLYENAQVRLDCSQLLFMICWSTWLINDLNGLSGHFILENMHLPCSISFYDRENPNALPSLQDEIMDSEDVNIYIKYFIHLGWFNNKTEISDIDIESFHSNINPNLLLNDQELACLSSSSCSDMWMHYLQVIKNARSHRDVRNALHGFLSICNLQYPHESQVLQITEYLEKFMKTPPASKTDKELFISLLEFIRKIAKYDKSGGCMMLKWANENMRNSSGPFMNVIKNFKNLQNIEDTLCAEILNTICLIYKELVKLNDYQDMSLPMDSKYTYEFELQIIQSFFENDVNIDCLAQCSRLLLCICYMDLAAIKQINIIELINNIINWLWLLNDERNYKLNQLGFVNHDLKSDHQNKDYFQIGNLTLMRALVTILSNAIKYMKVNSKQSESAWFEGLDNSVVLLSSLCSSPDIFLHSCSYQIFSGLLYTGEGSLFIMKKFTFHFGTFWFTCLNTLVDKNEYILARYQSGCCLVNLSSHIGINIKNILSTCTTDMDYDNDEENIIKHLLDIAEFSKSFEELVLSLFIDASESSISFRGMSQKTKNNLCEEGSVIIPDLIRVFILFMHNLTFISSGIIDYLYERKILSILLKCVRFETQGMDKSIEKLITAICYLISCAITKNTNFRMSFEMDHGSMYYLTAMIDTSYGVRYKMYSGILHLFSELAKSQSGRDAIIMAIRQCDEDIFLNTLCTCLTQTDNDELKICSLIFIINIFQNGKKDNNFCHILDTTKFESNDKACTYRIRFIDVLISLMQHHFLAKDTIDKTHYLFELCVDCLSMCLYMLQDNSSELHILYKMLLQRLNILFQNINYKCAENLKKLLDKKKQSEAEEIKLLFKLLSCLFTNVKLKTSVLASNTTDKAGKNSICQIIHKLMPFCLADDALLNACLECLHNYTEDCFIACRDMTNSAVTLYLRPVALSTEDTKAKSMLSAIINLIIQNNSKPHKKNFMRLLFSVLKNSCQTVEGRLAIYKSDLLSHVKSKTTKILPNNYALWITFLEYFTRYSEGQLSIVKNNELLSILIASSEDKSKLLRIKSLTILRNISFNSSNKTFLLNSKKYISVAITAMNRSDLEEVLYGVIMIWNLLANNQKAKSILKAYNIQDQITELNAKIKHNSDESDHAAILQELLSNFQHILNISKFCM